MITAKREAHGDDSFFLAADEAVSCGDDALDGDVGVGDGHRASSLRI